MELDIALETTGYDGPIEYGREIRICCPYHDDNNPSLDMNRGRGLFYCRSCHKGGTMIELFATLGNTSLFQASLLLSECEGFSPSLKKRNLRHREEAKKRAFSFYDYLPHVNWSLEESYSYLFERGYTADALHAAGAKLNRSSTHPFVFPVSEQGVFQGYVARSADGRRDKYKNNVGFVRTDLLEGDLCPGAVVLVEGILDKCRVVQCGWKNTSALFGSDFTEEQAAKLARIATRVINMLDPDKAGRAGGEKVHRYMQPYAIPVDDFPYENDKDDPGSLDENEVKERLFGLLHAQ